MNLEEENEIGNQIHLKQSGGKQVVAAINKRQQQQHVEKEKKEMKQNEFEMRSNCSAPSSSSFNVSPVEKAYTRRESQQDPAFSRLYHRRNNDTENNNHRLHKQANDERLNETLLVLKELLLSLTAKKEDDKNSEELDDSKVQLNKAALVNGGEIELPRTNECENSFKKDNNNNLVESRDDDGDTAANGGGKQVELLNEIAGSFERSEKKNELSSKRAQTKCLLAEEDFVKEDNKGGNSCCKYRENFANNNNSEGFYCSSIDHTLKVCEASCRFNHFDGDDEKKQDIRGEVNSFERRVTCSRQIDRQQTTPSSARSNTESDKKVQVVKREVFEDGDRDGGGSDTLKRLNVEEKRADDSLDKGLLASNCPSRIHWRASEAAAAATKFGWEKEATTSLERKNEIACEVETKQVSVRGTLKEKNDSENVNYTGLAKEEELDRAPRALLSLFPTSSATALHSKAGFNLALPRCHSKCYVSGDDDDENDATNNHHNKAPPKSTETETETEITTTKTATSKFYDSSIWCSKLSAARRNTVRTLKIRAAKVRKNKQPSHNSLDNELPQTNIAAKFRLAASRSNLSSKTVTKTGKTRTTTTTKLGPDVDENLTHPRWQTGMLVCSLAKRITTTKRPTLYSSEQKPPPDRPLQQQKLPLVNDQKGVEKEEAEESDAGLVEGTKCKQSSEKQPELKFHLSGDERTTKSFLISPLWLWSWSLQPFFGIEMGKRNRKRQQMRKQTNYYHHQRQQADVTLETLERSSLEYNGEQSSKSKEQIELTTPTVRTEAFKLGKSSLLTTDLSDLSELIKLLMLTITSKKHQHHLKQTEINNCIDNNDSKN